MMKNIQFKEAHMCTVSFSRGFTLVELLITIAIILILAGLVVSNIGTFVQGQALNNGVDETIALINEARSRTLAGENGDEYGVHLQSDKAVLFVGPTYSSSASTNKVVTLDSSIVIGSISLGGGGSDVLFDRITGDTNNYGTYIVKKSSTTTGQKTITISKTGLVSTN